jgi:hypothetical protein
MKEKALIENQKKPDSNEEDCSAVPIQLSRERPGETA